MKEENHLLKADKVEIKESDLSEQPLAPVPREPEAKQILQEIDAERKKILSGVDQADFCNPNLDIATRLLLLLYVAGLGAFGSWIVYSGSPYFAVSTFVVGSLIVWLIAKMAGNRLDELYVKNPVGMKFVVGLSFIGMILATWLLMRFIFAIMGWPADR